MATTKFICIMSILACLLLCEFYIAYKLDKRRKTSGDSHSKFEGNNRRHS